MTTRNQFHEVLKRQILVRATESNDNPTLNSVRDRYLNDRTKKNFERFEVTARLVEPILKVERPSVAVAFRHTVLELKPPIMKEAEAVVAKMEGPEGKLITVLSDVAIKFVQARTIKGMVAVAFDTKLALASWLVVGFAQDTKRGVSFFHNTWIDAPSLFWMKATVGLPIDDQFPELWSALRAGMAEDHCFDTGVIDPAARPPMSPEALEQKEIVDAAVRNAQIMPARKALWAKRKWAT